MEADLPQCGLKQFLGGCFKWDLDGFVGMGNANDADFAACATLAEVPCCTWRFISNCFKAYLLMVFFFYRVSLCHEVSLHSEPMTA